LRRGAHNRTADRRARGRSRADTGGRVTRCQRSRCTPNESGSVPRSIHAAYCNSTQPACELKTCQSDFFQLQLSSQWPPLSIEVPRFRRFTGRGNLNRSCGRGKRIPGRHPAQRRRIMVLGQHVGLISPLTARPRCRQYGAVCSWAGRYTSRLSRTRRRNTRGGASAFAGATTCCSCLYVVFVGVAPFARCHMRYLPDLPDLPEVGLPSALVQHDSKHRSP
jgi:hypothetical protein